MLTNLILVILLSTSLVSGPDTLIMAMPDLTDPVDKANMVIKSKLIFEH